MIEKFLLQDYYEKISAFIPIYKPELGNATSLFLKDGTAVQTLITTRTMLIRLAYCFAVDLKALRFQCSKSLNRKLNLPLPLRPDFTLIPLRVRQPKFSKDGANGYICLQDIAGVTELKEPPFRSAVILKSKVKIKSLSHPNTVLARIRDGEYLTSKYSWGGGGEIKSYGDLIPPQQLIATIHEFLKLYNNWGKDV
ncbi:MAG TPA: hypothetical protein GXX38_04480 [Clostridia bacterium]|nr:hypothetical protein [Clostridia bacterium]